MLPKNDVPIYEVDLPLSSKKVRFRPFLVKEEKLLLMAMESDDDKTMISSIKQIVNNCCLDELDVNNLPILDLEFFFLNLRARSINDVVELQYKCNNKLLSEDDEEKICNNIVKLDVNLLDIKPEKDLNHTNKIELTKDMGVIMKYPNFKMVDLINENSDVEKIIKIICDCVESVYDKENIYYNKDVSPEELLEFIENLTRDQFVKIENFFNTMPKIKKNLNFKCGKCGYNEEIVIEGIQNFFV